MREVGLRFAQRFLGLFRSSDVGHCSDKFDVSGGISKRVRNNMKVFHFAFRHDQPMFDVEAGTVARHFPSNCCSRSASSG